MGSDKNVLRGIFPHQRATVIGEEYGNRIGLQQSPGRNVGTHAVDPLATNAGIGEIDVFDDVVQCNVRVKTRGPCECRDRKTSEGRERVLRGTEAREDQIEPDDIRLEAANGIQKPSTSDSGRSSRS